GDRETFTRATEQIDRAIAQPELRTAAGRALLEVARGYYSLGDYDSAESAALGALASATEFRESKIQFAAEALIATVRERAAVHPVVEGADTAVTGYGDELAADFVRTLETIAG